MTILELQKRLQELYKEYGNREIVIQNGDDGGVTTKVKELSKVCMLK